MNILFDHQIFAMQDYGGISRYFYELIKRLNSNEHHAEVLLKFSNNVYLDKGTAFPFFPNHNFKGKKKLCNYLGKTYSLNKMKSKEFDIFHPTYYDPYFLKNIENAPFVVTFFDMIQEKFRDTYDTFTEDKAIDHKAIVAAKASRIIAISESTKNDMVEMLGVDPNKIEVVYLGSSFDATHGKEASEHPFPYLLYVGNRETYKNFSLFLEAVLPLLSKNELKLVCAGGGAFNETERRFIDALGLKDAVVYSPINDTLLANLYKHAKAFVFPSLYEGFGIPVLEAFACDCPCVISETSSLPEVGGSAAIYFNPQDKSSILQSVSRLLNEEKLRENLIIAGRERLKQFSWDKMAQDTVAVYKNI